MLTEKSTAFACGTKGVLAASTTAKQIRIFFFILSLTVSPKKLFGRSSFF
jgi:hypothetical protein